jgi:hypothetical protein
MAEWLVDASGNRHNQTYVNGFVDISGSDLSGNALTVRNGNLSLPNSSISSFAISGGIGHDYMLFESQDTGSTSVINFYDMAFNVYGTANFLADNRMYKWNGSKNGVGTHWNILNFNPGFYRVTLTGRFNNTGNHMSFGFDTDADGSISYPNGFTEEGNALNTSDDMSFTYTVLYKVQSVQNFNIITRNLVTVYSYNGLGYVQLLVERLGFLKNNGQGDQSVSQQPGTNNSISGGTNDTIAGSFFGTNPTKPTDADEYIDLNENGTEWMYRIDPTGALFNA